MARSHPNSKPGQWGRRTGCWEQEGNKEKGHGGEEVKEPRDVLMRRLGNQARVASIYKPNRRA